MIELNFTSNLLFQPADVYSPPPPERNEPIPTDKLIETWSPWEDGRGQQGQGGGQNGRDDQQQADQTSPRRTSRLSPATELAAPQSGLSLARVDRALSHPEWAMTVPRGGQSGPPNAAEMFRSLFHPDQLDDASASVRFDGGSFRSAAAEQPAKTPIDNAISEFEAAATRSAGLNLVSTLVGSVLSGLRRLSQGS